VTRRVIANNVKHRLKDESGYEAKGALDCHHHGVSIRKNLTAMMNARKDLANVKEKAMKALGEEEKVDFRDAFDFKVDFS